MKVIKPMYCDQGMGSGLFILIAESGIDIELLEQLNKEFAHLYGTRVMVTGDYAWLEVFFEESYLKRTG